PCSPVSLPHAGPRPGPAGLAKVRESFRVCQKTSSASAAAWAGFRVDPCGLNGWPSNHCLQPTKRPTPSVGGELISRFAAEATALGNARLLRGLRMSGGREEILEFNAAVTKNRNVFLLNHPYAFHAFGALDDQFGVLGSMLQRGRDKHRKTYV